MFLLSLTSCFEGLYGWPVFSFSFCLSFEAMTFLGREEVATSDRIGISRLGVDAS
jgi:hypothetical protein